MSITEPGKLLTPWAASGLKNEIPQAASSVTGRAGFDQGFPAINMTPKEEGGIPPFGQDFNGIFYEITKILQYMQAGGQPKFDADFASAIGGYPAGAILSSDDGMSLFRSVVDGNITNPNLGGDGWARPDLQIMELYRRSYAEAGYVVIGNFGQALTISPRTQVVIELKTGKGYIWAGLLSKSITPDSTLSNSGGVTENTWVDVSGNLLRNEVLAHINSEKDAHNSSSIAHGNKTVSEELNGLLEKLNTANADNAVQDDKISALQSAQTSGVYGFATKADMLASTNIPDNAIAYVTNDPVATDNGTYRKSDGSWVQSSSDLASQAYGKSVANEGRIDNLEGKGEFYETEVLKTFKSFINPDAEYYGRVGYYSGTAVVDNASYKTTGLYPVKPGDKFVLLNSNAQGAYFDASKNQLWSVSFTNNAVNVVPDNVVGRGVPAYVSFSSTVSKFDGGLLCAGMGQLVPSSPVPFGQLITEVTSQDLSDKIFNISRRDKVTPAETSFCDAFDSFIDPNAEHYGRVGYYNGNVVVNNSSYKTTGLYPVKPGDKFVLLNSNAQGAYFDANKVQLWHVSFTNNAVNVVPANHFDRGVPAYVSFSSTADRVDNRLLCAGYGDVVPPAIIPFGETYARINNIGIIDQFRNTSALTGVGIAAFGDSITAGNDNWPKVFSAISGASFLNYAASGGHWEDFPEAVGSQNLSVQIANFLAAAPSVSAAIIAMGTNSLNAEYGDFNQAVSGDVDAVDRTKIFGGMRYAIEKLRKYDSNMTICLVTPLQRQYTSAEDPKMVSMRDAIKRMGGYMGCPVFDACTESGITHQIEKDARVHLYDGLHTSASGKALQGRYILAKFKGVFTATI